MALREHDSKTMCCDGKRVAAVRTRQKEQTAVTIVGNLLITHCVIAKEVSTYSFTILCFYYYRIGLITEQTE